MINFKYVRWKNFLSTGNQFIEIQLDKNPTTLIIGENGAGKSTILDALCFGLFGKPFRMISKNLLVNSVNNSSTVVEVEFSVGTKEYKVIRCIKPNKFEIYQNGKLMRLEANVRDYKKILEQQILKLNYRSFTQVVILGSSTFVPFMQLKARHRREVVEEILDIQIFSTMNILLKQKLKSIVEELREVDYSFSLVSERITLQENYIDDIKKNKDNIIDEKQKTFEKNEKEIEERMWESKHLTEDNQTLLESIIGEDKVVDKRDKLKDIQFMLKDKESRGQKLISFFEENDDCPTCQQHIDEEFKVKSIDEKTKEVTEVSEGLNKLSDEMKKVESKIKEYKNTAKSIRENEIAFAKLTSGITQLEKFNAKLQTEIETLLKGNVSNEDTEKLIRLKQECIKVERQRTDLRDEKSYA